MVDYDSSYLENKNSGALYLKNMDDDCFDISRVPGNGVLIFPLSMSRLHLGQDPKTLYDFLCFFDEKVIEKNIDVVFLYTNGLYFNNVEASSSYRKKTTAQMLTHKQELDKIIRKHNKFSPRAIHYLPWDYVILQSEQYLDLHSQMAKLMESDRIFNQLLRLEMKSNIEPSPEAYAFIIEETIVTYLIRNKLVPLPTTLSDMNGWRLLVYPGGCLTPDVYLYKEKILHQNKLINSDNWFNRLTSSSMYNMDKKVLVDYNKININDLVRGDCIDFV